MLRVYKALCLNASSWIAMRVKLMLPSQSLCQEKLLYYMGSSSSAFYAISGGLWLSEFKIN